MHNLEHYGDKPYILTALPTRGCGAQHLPLMRHAWLVQELDEGVLAQALGLCPTPKTHG